MRVLHVSPSIAVGRFGVTEAVRELCEGLLGAGLEVELWTTRRGFDPVQDDPADRRFREAGGVLRYFNVHPLAPLGERYAFAPGIRAALQEAVRKADLVHIHAVWLYTTWVAARWCRRLNIPYVLSPCGGLDPYGMKQHPLFKTLYGRLVERKNLAGAAAVHFTSPYEQRRACLFGTQPKSAVVPRSFRAGQIPAAAAGGFRKRHPELSGRKLLLFLGRLHPKKQPELAAKAFVRLAQKRNDLQLILAGPDEGGLCSARMILKQAGFGDRLSLPGAVHGDEKWSLYLDSDLFLLPSQDENFGVTAMEAMAAGLPVLLSPLVGVAEAVETAGAGRTAALDPDAWAETAGAMLDDPEALARMGQAGRHLVEERFCPERITAQMKSLYDELLKGGRALRKF